MAKRPPPTPTPLPALFQVVTTKTLFAPLYAAEKEERRLKREQEKKQRSDKSLRPIDAHQLSTAEYKAKKEAEKQEERLHAAMIPCLAIDILDARIDSEYEGNNDRDFRWLLYKNLRLMHASRVSIFIDTIRRAPPSTTSKYDHEYIVTDSSNVELRVLFYLQDDDQASSTVALPTYNSNDKTEWMRIDGKSELLMRELLLHLEEMCSNNEANLARTNYALLCGTVTAHQRTGLKKLFLMHMDKLENEPDLSARRDFHVAYAQLSKLEATKDIRMLRKGVGQK